MPHPPALDDWVAELVPALGLDGAEVDVDAVLDLASRTAHAVARPAAPLSAYLVGIAVGRGVPYAEAVAVVERIAPERS